MADKNNDWRSKVNAMMTDQNYAAKAASVIGDTRSKNLKLMNKSAEDYPALSVGQQTKSPLGLASVLEMQKKQAARATMDSNDEDYSGVVDLATKLFDEERTKRANKAADEMRDANTGLKSEWDVTLENLGKLKGAADISKTYEAIISNPSLQQAVRLNANKALVKALEANPSMSQEEQHKLFNETIDKQLQKMGEGIGKYLRGKNEVSGTSEYLIRSAANNSAFGKAMQLVAKNIGGSEGESAYQQQALADYDANKAKWWEQGLGIAGGLVLDAPLMQGIGSAANATMGRATMWGLGKAGGKALQASTVGRIATGAAVSSGTLGGYNATSALANQLMEGRFDVGEIAASAGHGFMLGALTGGMSPWLRGVSAGMGKVGKVATMTSGLATEAGIFTASELSEMENPYDLETIGRVFGKNVAVIGGLKVSNLPKTIKEYKQWYTEGKQSNFTDADYKVMADFAKANGYAADDAFTMSADGTYSRSVADRVTGNRTLLTMTKLQGGKEQNLAIEMYNDPNVPLSLKTKIAAKMNLPAPPPVLANGVRVEGNKAITYYTMPNGQQQVIDIKEFDRPRKARAYANEFSRTTARRNDLLQSEASVNVMMSQPMVVARLNEQAKRNGTTLAEEKARMDAILQRAADGTITQEDIAYYRSIVEDDVITTESLKKDIKDKYGVEIDEVLNKEGNFSAAEDGALTAYGNALRGIIERGNPTTERTATAAMAGIEDYVALNNLGIEQTSAILANPQQRAAIEQQTRSHYAAWLKYFDGRMSEDALAQKLGLDLNNTSDLQTFLAEQTYFKTKAADRIAYNTAEAAKQLLERGDGGVRFLDDGRVKLKGVPFAVEVNESIAARYEAAKQGSGEPMQRIANDALKDIIKQSETPAEQPMEMPEATAEEPQPMTEAEAVTQQMVDARLAEIDTDLQGIEADGVQRMTINGKPVAIIKGRIVADENGQVDKTKSSAEVAYMLLDENGRPILNEQGKPIIEVGVKPSNVHVEDIEQWRSVDDYKASEEQRIRDNNRITDEAMRQVDEQTADENQVPTEPKTADDLLAMCDGDKALALDVATDELAKAMQAKGKGATPTETIEINRRIRMYQQMVDRLSATEQPESAALPEAEQTETKAEPQVTEDMEFVYQQGLDENHEGMEPMQTTDDRYKWVGLQRGELTATMGERDVELLDNLAKKLGVAVIPINVKDRAVNGYYKDGNIYVNTNRGAEWTMRWVAGHEMLHDVAKKSPEAYDAYKQAVLDMWGSDYIESQVKQIIEDYAASGKTIDREQALTELVNDFGGDLFSSRDGLKILDGILKDQSSKGNTGFIETIKKWWDNIKEFFGVSPYANEVEKKLADAYKEAIANAEEFRRNQEMNKGVSSVTDAARVEGAAIDFSIKTEPQVAQRLREYAESKDGKKHGWDKEKIESIIYETEDLIDAIHNSLQGNQRYDAWADKNPTMRVDWRDGKLKQTVTWSRGNVEYKYDMSADLLCINNEALEDVLASPAMVQIVRGMDALSKNGFTSDDYLRIYQVLRDKGFVVPCAGCFDAAARFKMLPSIAKNFADLVNKTIDERNADPEAFDAKVKAMAKGKKTIEGLPTSANTEQDAIMIGVAGDKLTEHITSEQLLSAQGQTDILANLGGIFRAWQKTGMGRPKDKLLPEPYVGDINSTTTTIIGAYGKRTPSYRDIYVNQGTGLRRNSHSEFRPLLAIDEIQFMRDAFAKGLTVFKYMKELDDVRLFGNMGVKFNMSFFPAFVKDGVAAGLDANGNYIASEESVGSREFAYMGEDGRTHFDGMKGWQEAQKYTNENVSLSSVVFSVPHLIKSLTDVPTPSDKSGMWGSLIPFHSTGATSAHLALQGLGRARANGTGHPFSEALYDYNKGVTNFEDVQNDRFGEGWVIIEGKKAGTAIKNGHKLEFANGTHMYNAKLGVHLFNGGYIFDKDVKKEDNYGNGKVNTKNVKKYMTKFYIDYNDKVRELGGDYAYKDAADYYLRELPKIGLIPRFSFEVPESIYLEMCKAANVDPKHPKLGWKGEGNAWNPIDAESYYSLFCDYGMTDPKTGKWSPHKPIGNVDENGNRVFRLPDNAVQIVKDAVDKYSARRDKEESRINDVYEEFLKRSVKDGRLSEAEAQSLLSEISTDPNGGDKPTEDSEFSIKADKQKQLDIINRTNPAHDDYHTWIRTTDDIKTLQEAVDEVKAEDADYNLSTYPDVSDDMINEALQSGKITIYSSKPIKEGVFVSPSKMQAKDYAGGGRIYSKQVSISDVAWINTDEGMFAPTEYSVKGKRADESVLDYAKRMSEETGKKNLLNGDADYSVVRGGITYDNDGYTQREDGTNISVRAQEAEESGTYSKGNFIKAYKVAKRDFDILSSLGIIKNTEWHHTGANFAKTDFYSWADSERSGGNVEYGNYAETDPNSLASMYKANKKEIGALVDAYNKAEWSALPKVQKDIPTIEQITDNYIQKYNPDKHFISDWLTKEEKTSKLAEHEDISRGGEAYGTSHERYQMHEGVDSKYNKIALNHKNEWVESNKEHIQREYDSLKAEIDNKNASITPLVDIYPKDPKGKHLMKILEMLGYSAEDAAKKVYREQYSYYSSTVEERANKAKEDVNKEYNAKVDSMNKDLEKWLKKAIKDGKVTLEERLPNIPENFVITKEEMNGRYGWFEASSRYNLHRYYSGYKFSTKRMFDSYQQKLNDIRKLKRERDDKAIDAFNGVRSELYSNTDYSIKQPKDAEYEAKEQWRKDNAGAIASSFFAERRADKAAEVERLKKKISELKADNTKAASEDKAKVREIADEMHKYIKKNIPTENQGDMTRQQFESVLKQLETAVTKQELEKPMQMVEYIGANVARRALTRQMRDFVKNGFKALTPKGLAKPKTVDGVTSRVLGLVKTLYQSMNKNAFGSDLYKLQKQVREEKAKLEQFNADNGGKYQDVVDKVNEILGKTGIDRYEELYKYFDEQQAAGDVDGDVLGYIGRMLPLLDSIELTKDQQKQAKADSAIVTKEDLDQLRTSLEEKRDKGILSEEDKAVLDNMPLYEAMLSLHQQQLNIDGPGASSLAMQIKAKVDEIKNYSKGLDGVTDENSNTAIRYKTRIKEANNELQELFAARIVDQKAVNANVSELLDNLKEIRDTGKSKLQEWSKAKQERATRLVKMANESFGKDAKGYWSEVDKRGKLKKDFINWANNLRLSVLMSPAMSFEYMLGVMDPRYYTNSSPIYKQFIKSSEGLIKANDNFFEGTESYNMAVNEAVERFINRNAMTNLKEYFRRGDRFATAIIPFEVKVSRNGVDEYIPKEEMMTRGQAAKIYAWSRMADGMAKLKAHGVTDNTLTKVKEFIGEDYMNFIDWVEDEFFPRLRRERYNPVYKQMYGISMAENDHYFPFLIYQKDVRTEQELEVSNNDTLGGGVVGNLVERKRNNARLDFTAKSLDIFDMITDYGRKMEEWAAYAQVREDLKKVVNDKQFKQHCDELGTHYYKYFLEAAQVASRLSRDMAMTQHTQSGWAKAQKTIASAAISLRVSTALKQLLSAPAFIVYSLDPAFHHELIKTVQPIDVESAVKGLWKLAEGDMGEAKKLLLSENWVGHYNWCVKNLPSFRERVTLGGAGNPILEEKGFSKFADGVQSVGMLPNRLVDAFTCSVGAKAIYEYAFKKYKKNYSEKTAHNMAVTDAEIAFNSSQQSSNPVFLAPMQASKQFLLRGMMNYKNAPIGYYRNAMKASIDMYRATKAIFGQPKFTINGEVYGFENDGKNPFAMAAESGARASMFWLFLNLIWNFGTVGVAGLSYTMLNGSKNDDGNTLYTDEEIKKALGDNMGWALFNAATQGIPWVSGFASAAQTGQDYTPSILFSEMNNYVEQINKDGFMSMATAQIFTDLLLKNAAGVDPEVWGQIYRGAQGIMEDRPMRIEDFMNLIASPRSAISGVTKQRVGEYDRLRDYVNDRIESNRQLGVDERMTFGKKLTGMRELSKKSLGMYVDEYLADKIPGYREFTNKPTEMEKEEEVANSNTLNAASSLYETIVRKEEEKEEKKDKIKDRSTKRKIKVLTKVANVIHKLCEVNDFETAERVANEMERRVKRGYNPDGKTIEEKLKNVDVWDSTGTTEQRSADGFSTAFDRARKGGFDSYLRRGKD